MQHFFKFVNLNLDLALTINIIIKSMQSIFANLFIPLLNQNNIFIFFISSEIIDVLKFEILILVGALTETNFNPILLRHFPLYLQNLADNCLDL